MKIAIANDTHEAVEAVRHVLLTGTPLGRAPHRLAWVARDGAEAVRRCAEERPDLLLLDPAVPGSPDGVEATRLIMAHSPCAILLVSAQANGHTGRIFDAMGAGALDVVAPPIGGLAAAAEFLARVELMGRYLGNGGTREKPLAGQRGAAVSASNGGRATRLVAIGASAGGPPALAEVLGRLPTNFGAAVVVVQHLDATFAQGLADWLHGQSALPVRLAEEGDLPQPGKVLLAGAGGHLAFAGSHALGYTPHTADCAYCPSVDVFFESAARAWRGETVGVLLTGMGRDGAKGLKTLRDKGCLTIAQDRATSAIYGMPKQAAAIGAAVEILPLGEVAPALARWAARPVG